MIKSKSFAIIQKTFNDKLKGKWNGNADIIFRFLETYLKKKYNGIMHFLPFIELRLLIDHDNTNNYFFDILDYTNKKVYPIKKNTSSINSYINRYKNTNKRFTFFPVHQSYIIDNKENGHSILFLYDKKYNEVELFNSTNDDFNSYKKRINVFFKKIYGKKVKVIYPKELPNTFASLEEEKCLKNKFSFYKSDGYCTVWMIWYLELRLANKSLSMENVFNKALQMFKDDNKLICKTIRGYAQFIEKMTRDYTILKDKNGGLIMVVKKRGTYTKYILPSILISTIGLISTILLILNKIEK